MDRTFSQISCIEGLSIGLCMYTDSLKTLDNPLELNQSLSQIQFSSELVLGGYDYDEELKK